MAKLMTVSIVPIRDRKPLWAEAEVLYSSRPTVLGHRIYTFLSKMAASESRGRMHLPTKRFAVTRSGWETLIGGINSTLRPHTLPTLVPLVTATHEEPDLRQIPAAHGDISHILSNPSAVDDQHTALRDLDSFLYKTFRIPRALIKNGRPHIDEESINLLVDRAYELHLWAAMNNRITQALDDGSCGVVLREE